MKSLRIVIFLTYQSMFKIVSFFLLFKNSGILFKFFHCQKGILQ